MRRVRPTALAALCLLPCAVLAAAAKPASPRATDDQQPAPAPVAAPRASGTGWFGHDSRLRVPQFNDEFAGLDLSALTAEKREAFVQRANSEPCPCAQSGCDRHTLAFCFKVDPGCPVARKQLTRLAAELAPPKP